MSRDIITNVKVPDKRAGPYRECVGAAALGGPPTAILQVAIKYGKYHLARYVSAGQ